MVNRSFKKMNILKRDKSPPVAFASDDDMLQKCCNRNLMVFGWAIFLFLVPFTINNFIQSRYLLAILTTTVVIVAMVNSFFLKKNHRTFIPVWCYFLCIFLALLSGIASVGANALYWCYPFLLAIFFLNDNFVARVKAIVIFIILVPYTYYLFEPTLVIRFILTLFMLCYLSDMLVRRQLRLQFQMADLIIRDPLTNAFNRRHMNSCTQMAIEEIKRGLDSVSLLWLDIDHFKMVNDQFGHEAGDQVLIKFVDILHKRQRQVDYVFRAGVKSL